LYEEDPVTIDGKTIHLNFTYEPHKKSVKQDKLIESAVAQLTEKVPAAFTQIFSLAPTEKNKKRTLLEKHLNDFSARNTFDYFIHKDLGGFLTRELDFYIKNEVLFIDDINTDNEQAFTTQLSKIRALKQVASKIITFLAQLENFQKKLWLKKKFVISCDYCITLDRIPESYYNEIANNPAQLSEWKTLFDVDIKKQEDLTNEPYLVLDTKFFSQEFKDKLLAEFDDLDEQTDGVLINSENFQTLNLIRNRFKGQVNMSYIDPPYNAQSSQILYKNSFKHSSWLSLMQNRISISKELLHSEFVYVVAIDEVEQELLGQVLSHEFDHHEKSCLSIIHNATGQQGTNFSYTHEFAYFIFPIGGKRIGLENREDNPDIRPLRNVSKGSHLRTDAANCFYPIYIKDGEIIGFGDVSNDEFHPNGINIKRDDGIIEVYPIDPQGLERKWVFARNSVESIKGELVAKYDKKKEQWDIIRTKTRFNYKTVWSGSKYSANSYGSRILNEMLPNNKFTYPKSIHTVMNSIDAGLNNSKNGLVLDFFAGSGTTGQAVTKLNRRDGGYRKVILVEMGEYFHSVTKPRMIKSVYADSYKNGIAQDDKGISWMFKYFNLESYEDALNNLHLKPNQAQQQLLDTNTNMQEEYLLQYMLDVESRDQLLNIQAFKNPFSYKLNITENNELVPTNVDLVETFNYLIGLHVKRVQRSGAFKTVEGVTNSGDKVLVMWRNLEESNNEDLNTFVKKMDYNLRDGEFDTIYVNGDNNLANLRQDEETWKVLLLEEVFFTAMFDNKDI